MDYDVIIVGLGPAGSTLARLLNKEFNVLALDKKQPNGDEGFHKPCGGLLATDAQRAFIRFQLNLPTHILTNPQIFSVKTFDLQTDLIRNYQRTYVNLDRHKFDLWLKSLIPNNIDVRHNALCKQIVRIAKGYQVTFIDDGQEYTVTTQYLVGADGANSIVRRTQFPQKTLRQYIAIQQWFTEKHPVPFYSCIFDNRITDCYAWSISKDNYFIFGGAFPKKGAAEKFDQLKNQLEQQYQFLFDEPIKTEKCLVTYPQKWRDFYVGDNHAFLIGESAGFISASSLEGISYAFDSAQILAEIINSKCDMPNQRYARKTFKLRLKLFSKIVKANILTTPFLRKLIMKSKITHINNIKRA